MDYKEKLRLAKEALDSGSYDKDTIEYIFPELKESENGEDKRISKEITKFLKQNNGWNREWLTWLEKQGEQKSINDTDDDIVEEVKEASILDMVEPKLKIESGKWYVCIRDVLDDYGDKAFCKGDVYLSEKDEYLIPCNSNVPRYLPYCVDTYFRNWTIKDAKSGDVLVNGSNIFIFHFINSTRLMGYCHVNTDNGKFYNDIGKNECFCLIDAVVNPATKEQRDLLFQKMKEAGYEWDSKKKELKKIEEKSADEVKPRFKVGDWVVYNYPHTMYPICLITAINENYVELKDLKGGQFQTEIYDLSINYHLWTISDAKNGDVLAVEGRRPFIFKDFSDISRTIVAYCGINGFDKFEISTCNQWWTSCKVCPATKKQRNTLMTAMAGAGYTFDFEKKMLKKVEE